MMSRLITDEAGITISELMVAIAITSITTLLLTTITFTTNRIDTFAQDDSSTLAELRIATERITKEIRQSRIIYPDSTDRLVHFWVDYDLDNQQDDNERISWEVRTESGDTDLVRYTEADPTPVVIAESYVDGPTFSYDPVVDSVPRVVTITLTMDGDPDKAPGSRVIESEIRIRNGATT